MIGSKVQRWFSASCAALALFLSATASTQNAVANGDTRTLSFHHTHTGEDFTITFKRNGYFDEGALEKLNWGLRDWRTDAPTKMDPRLFDIVWEVYQQTGSSEAIHILSAYRSPETNAMLRRRSRQVAEHSQHILGKALDFYLPDMTMSKVRELGLKLARGGVGYYPHANTVFVHLDAGGVRYWPRMTHDQLARVFPDGKTVLIASDGQPMSGYQVALAEIEARGGSAPDVAPAQGKGLFAWLFGGGNTEGEEEVVAQKTTVSKNKRIALAKVTTGEDAADAAVAPPGKAEPAAKAEAPKVVASLTSGKPMVLVDGNDANAGVEDVRPVVVPAPPRRPKDLDMLAFNAPLPPSRPTELAMLVPKNDAISKLLDKPAATGSVPALIANGTKSAVAAVPDALAYAAPSTSVEPPTVMNAAPLPAKPLPPKPAPRPAVAKIAAPQKLALVAAKLDSAALRVNPASVHGAASLNGSVIGLRQAAQRQTPDLVGSALAADLAPKSARLVSSFEQQTVGTLALNQFSGEAVRALTPEDGFKQLEDVAAN